MQEVDHSWLDAKGRRTAYSCSRAMPVFPTTARRNCQPGDGYLLDFAIRTCGDLRLDASEPDALAFSPGRPLVSGRLPATARRSRCGRPTVAAKSSPWSLQSRLLSLLPSRWSIARVGRRLWLSSAVGHGHRQGGQGPRLTDDRADAWTVPFCVNLPSRRQATGGRRRGRFGHRLGFRLRDPCIPVPRREASLNASPTTRNGAGRAFAEESAAVDRAAVQARRVVCRPSESGQLHRFQRRMATRQPRRARMRPSASGTLTAANGSRP